MLAGELCNFSLRINIIDFILSEKNERFDDFFTKIDNKKIYKSSVLRIFGTTETGNHECLIIHKFYNYIYVNIPVKDDEIDQFKKSLLSFIVSSLGYGSVYDMIIVNKTSIYGYQESENFLKIYITNYEDQMKLFNHLQNFLYNGHRIRVYEAHIQPIIKFLVEFDLVGFGYIKLKNYIRVDSPMFCKYFSELHCNINDIDPVNYEDILGHLDYIFQEHHGSGETLNTQMPTPIVSQVSQTFDLTDIFNHAQRLQSSLFSLDRSYLKVYEKALRYDPDVKIEKIIKEEKKTQKEIEDILDDEKLDYQESPSFFKEINNCTIDYFCSDHIDEIKSYITPILKGNYKLSLNSNFLKDSNDSSNLRSEEDSQYDACLSHNALSRYIDVMYIEVAYSSREKLYPSPGVDAVCCVSIILVNNDVIIDHHLFLLNETVVSDYNIVVCEDEIKLFESIISFILEKDPDVIVSYDNERENLGYLQKRYNKIKNDSFYKLISRTGREANVTESCRLIEGRILISLWRVVRRELPLRSYSISAVHLHFFKHPFPQLTYSQLATLYKSLPHILILYLVKKTEAVIAISHKLNFINNHCEMAFISGCDFYSAYSLGSLFQVECLIKRVASKMKYILFSPYKHEIFQQRAPTSFPFLIDPISGYYKNPVLFIRFHSLYSSVIVANNLDYSTLLMRMDEITTKSRIGVLERVFDYESLNKLINSSKVVCSPNDVLYVTSSARKGVLNVMLSKILQLRTYIEDVIKKNKNIRLQSTLNTLKHLSSSAHDYVSNFYSSGMSCVELSDSIVECSKGTLEKCVCYLKDNFPQLKIIYGDTDSLFVEMPNNSIQDCFTFVKELHKKLTSVFPFPFNIKLEKIYFGCLIISKRKYCGWCYKSKNQEKPFFDVKGLEITKRNTCPLVSRTMLTIVESIIETQNTAKAQILFRDILNRIIYGDISLDEFFFSREVKLGTYKTDPPCVYVSKRMMDIDHMRVPLYGERIHYLVVVSEKSQLIERVISPEEYISSNYHIVATRYYIKKQIIPALNNILGTLNIDIKKWIYDFSSDLKKLKPYFYEGKKTVIDHFYMTNLCPLCLNQCFGSSIVCSSCLNIMGKSEVYRELITRYKKYKSQIYNCDFICNKCIGFPGLTVNGCFCVTCKTYWERYHNLDFASIYESYLTNYVEKYYKQKKNSLCT